MSDPVLILVLAALVGGVSGFTAAVLFISAQQQHLKEQALEFRKSARRLESASKMESVRFVGNQGSS